jgi:hypothetical protein
MTVSSGKCFFSLIHRMLEAIIPTTVEIKKVSDNVGFGMYIKELLANSSVVYQSRPFVSIQHTANRRFVKACQNCHKLLGSVRDRFRTIFNEDKFQGIDLCCLPNDGNDFVNCVCGEVYCSPQCGAEAYDRHHYCLCVVGSGIHGAAVSEFKFFCLSVEGCGDNLLLLAQLLATVCSASKGNYEIFGQMLDDLLTFTNRPFNEVARPPSGASRDREWEDWLRETLTEAFELLSNALVNQTEIFRKFFENKRVAFDVLSRLLSVFELNNIDIAIPSNLRTEVSEISKLGLPIETIIREKEVVMRALWNDEARGIYEDECEDEANEDMSNEVDEEYDEDDERDHCHDEEFIDEMLNQIRSEIDLIPFDRLLEESEYPDFHGSGLFLTVARTNHSCDPNVTMDFEIGNTVVSCKALRDLMPGEELRMSYISCPSSRSKNVRRDMLKDYFFTCNCSLCSSQ